MNQTLTAEEAKQYSEHSLFADKSWRWSPNPWPLSPDICRWIEDLGEAALAFYHGIDLLYKKSWKGESLIRNDSLYAPWVADYYDVGKPDWLIKHGRSDAVRTQIPAVLRPDLIPHADGIALTELDSVPGGVGLTAHLEIIYDLIENPKMVENFGHSLADAAAQFGGKSANMVISVSEEAETYLPEMEWICQQLVALGFSIQTCNPNDLEIMGDSVLYRGEKVNLIYRFWELFDYENVKIMPSLARLVEEGSVTVTPPMKPVQEEKLSLALFHHHRLEPFWKENLSKKHFDLLKATIPKSWILDPREVPPGASLEGPLVQGRRLTSWSHLSKASRKERSLVLKASGFHETAWGARSVVIGDDVSSEDWDASITRTIQAYPDPIYVVQEFMKPRSFTHQVYSETGESNEEKGRVRLSPYFFTFSKQSHWSGTLASFCPADKKVIHGMKDGSLMPCIKT